MFYDQDSAQDGQSNDQSEPAQSDAVQETADTVLDGDYWTESQELSALMSARNERSVT